jgi:hypothetical protein
VHINRHKKEITFNVKLVFITKAERKDIPKEHILTFNLDINRKTGFALRSLKTGTHFEERILSLTRKFMASSSKLYFPFDLND